MRAKFNPGYAAPILWGVKLGYSAADIAEGLGITEQDVRDTIEAYSGIRFPRPAGKDIKWYEPERRTPR